MICVCRIEDLDSGKQKKHLTLDTQNFSERDVIALRTDLVDARVYICAPDVLMLFSDNFDYQVCSNDAGHLPSLRMLFMLPAPNAGLSSKMQTPPHSATSAVYVTMALLSSQAAIANWSQH